MKKFYKPLVYISLFMLVAASDNQWMRKNYTDLVNPFVGTGGHGHTYPGATLPFGMVQLSPDTRLSGWDGCSGYHYSDNVIYGFSHTHLSGTGVADYCDILLMPTVGKPVLDPGTPADTSKGYCSKFSHEKENASPGFYAVHLQDYGIDVELTVSKRVGFHKYMFPTGGDANIIIDLNHRDKVIDSYIKVDGYRRIVGMRRSSSWAKDQRLFFVAEFSRPFKDFIIAVDNTMVPEAIEARGENIKAVMKYDTSNSKKVLLKVGISSVSIEGALRNLRAEVPHWNFERVKAGARKEWNIALSKIEIEGGTDEQQKIFYTAMYHSLIAPNLFMDVDGKYLGTDLKIHEAKDFTNYTIFSLWDTFRAAHPLFTIIEPERTVDFIKTFLAHYENGGKLPVWELAANYTGCMIGYHAVPVIVDAYMKGIRKYDVQKAFEAAKHSAELDHLGLKAYKAKGYIPLTAEPESVSKTLEYAYDDWCIAIMAKSLGRDDDYKRYIRRSQSYKNLFDPSTGFMRARTNAGWVTSFDPKEVNFNYTEANSWQYSFFVPHDIEGLIHLMGGKENFKERLDQLFESDTETTGRRQADITGMIGQYAHGNEPSHHMAYLYNYVNQPWKTQQRVRQILDTMYSSKPDGLCGNEDCGQMSAWYVLSAVGFYPVTPGQNIYVIGSPLFEKATIHTGAPKPFVVKTNNLTKKNIYIQSATLNGTPHVKTYIHHSDIMNGSTLVLEMGPEPNLNWGTSDSAAPRSFIKENVITPVPYVFPSESTFTEAVTVKIASAAKDGNVRIYYTLDGTQPYLSSSVYREPIRLMGTTTIKAFALQEGMLESNLMISHYKKVDSDKIITLRNRYGRQYPAGGPNALIDSIRGSKDFRTGAWQGYEYVDLDATVDLGEATEVNMISIRFIQQMESWIFFPSSVSFSISLDGEKFENTGCVKTLTPLSKAGAIIKDYAIQISGKKVRYVRIIAKNIGLCPDWHLGAGGKAWIFADEIVIE